MTESHLQRPAVTNGRLGRLIEEALSSLHGLIVPMSNSLHHQFRRGTVTVRASRGHDLMWTSPGALRVGRGAIVGSVIFVGVAVFVSRGHPEGRYFLLEVVALGVAALAARYALTCRRCKKSPVWWDVTRGKLLRLGWAFDRPDCPYCGLNVSATDWKQEEG